MKPAAFMSPQEVELLKEKYRLQGLFKRQVRQQLKKDGLKAIELALEYAENTPDAKFLYISREEAIQIYREVINETKAHEKS